MESILLETDRLFLKPGSLEDYYKVYEYDLLKLRDINGEFEFVKQDPKYIKEHVYPGSDNTIYDWVIYLKENGYPIGNIFAEMHDSTDNSNEIGYNLHPNYWGNAYMKEACIAVLGYLFEEGYDKIYCSYDEGNIKSKKSIEKTGFKLESIKEKAWKKNGVPITQYRYVMTKEMYDELYKTKKIR